ncbi:MAG TPA: hypothetical protein VNG90_00135 [Candidatus Acidoferrum sp.]|nr:hypothetical protein [Candidatus Acidoferrum sp.]
MKHSLYNTLRTFVAAVTIVATSALLPASASAMDYNLAHTEWKGTVTFVSGQNNGIVQQGDFKYACNHTLSETTVGDAGNFSGTGTWTQDGRNFVNDFVEPITGTNLEVKVHQTGTIAANGKTYQADGHGQLYQINADGSTTAIPGTEGDTVSVMTKQ